MANKTPPESPGFCADMKMCVNPEESVHSEELQSEPENARTEEKMLDVDL